jgi:Fe-S cluster assembly ATP-binding protein
MADFEIRDLEVSVEGKKILKGIDLAVNKGEIHAIMGPNGSGKSTLSYAIAGHPSYTIDKGQILFEGKDVLSMSVDERAKAGIFLAMQYPVVVPGVTMRNFLRTALNSIRGYDGKDTSKAISPKEFQALLKDKLAMLKMDESFLSRYVNDGFSGGEKKRAEILQMAVLQPKLAILDETDSGLDIDALRIVAEGVNKLFSPNVGIIIITHYQRILNYIKPHYVHVLVDGKIVKSGNYRLAEELEAQGYSWLEEGEVQEV